jgi:hypothetical protein
VPSVLGDCLVEPLSTRPWPTSSFPSKIKRVLDGSEQGLDIPVIFALFQERLVSPLTPSFIGRLSDTRSTPSLATQYESRVPLAPVHISSPSQAGLSYFTSKTSWVKPTGPEAYLHLKLLRPFYDHKLDDHWYTISPQILGLLKERQKVSSLQLMWFVFARPRTLMSLLVPSSCGSADHQHPSGWPPRSERL